MVTLHSPHVTHYRDAAAAFASYEAFAAPVGSTLRDDGGEVVIARLLACGSWELDVDHVDLCASCSGADSEAEMPEPPKSGVYPTWPAESEGDVFYRGAAGGGR